MNARAVVLAGGFWLASTLVTFGEAALDREFGQRIDLREHIGKTFLETLQTPIVGIDAEMDATVFRPIVMLPATDILDFAEIHFDKRVMDRLYWFYADGRLGVEQAIDTFSGQTITPAEFRETLRPVATALADGADKAGRATGATGALSLLVSGAGTLVIMDDHNHYYNVGYQDPDVTTGRSFAASNGRKLLDATHREYLRELNRALALSDESATGFYRVLLEILTATDTRGLSALPGQAQIAMVDFLSVYNAEQSRHEMVDLALSSPWGIDFAQVTLLGSFTLHAEMAMVGTEFVPGDIESYIKGSIGNSKPQFTRLSRLITTYAAQPSKRSQLVDRLHELTPVQDVALARELRGDIFRRVLFFLNREETQALAARNGPEITEAMLELLKFVDDEVSEIANHVKACVDGTKEFGCFGNWL